MLEASSEGEVEETYIHYYSQDEKNLMLQDLPERLFEIDDQTELMKQEIKAMKAELEILRKSELALRRNVRHGYEERKAKVFKMCNWETNYIQFVDDRGVIVSQRPMKPEERQKDLFDTKTVSISANS